MSTQSSAEANPVVVYDAMREAAARLSGQYIAMGELARADEVMTRARSIHSSNMPGQRAASQQFADELEALGVGR